MVIWSQVVMPVRLALASTTWKLGWGIFDRRNGEFSTGLDKTGSSGTFVDESVVGNPPAPRGGFAPATL
jgi:hypothetical protein